MTFIPLCFFVVFLMFFVVVFFYAADIDEISRLANLIVNRYLGLSIYITTLGSWTEGFMHYPPFGLIKISDSHVFQLLVELNGIENAIKVFKTRSKIVRFYSGCSIHIMLLIQISIIIQFILESEIQSYSALQHVCPTPKFGQFRTFSENFQHFLFGRF